MADFGFWTRESKFLILTIAADTVFQTLMADFGF